MSLQTCSTAWRGRVAANHHISDGICAAAAGLDRSAYRDAMTVVLDRVLSSPRPRLRTGPDRLTEWLREGRYATVFEAVGDPRGAWYLGQRRQTEAAVLGIAPDALESARPRYGYLRGSNESASALVGYGTVMVELDPAVNEYANVVLGDSMGSTNCGEDPTMAPERLASPGLDCRHSYTDIHHATVLAEACDCICAYAEVHIYDPLAASRIVEVLFTEGTLAPTELRVRLRNLDIPFLELDGAPPA